jgi:hypothetical protein
VNLREIQFWVGEGFHSLSLSYERGTANLLSGGKTGKWGLRGDVFHALIFHHGVKHTKWHNYLELKLHNLISVSFTIENICEISFENLP